MLHAEWLVGISLVFQVPAPSPASDPAAELKAAARSILEREARALEVLAAGVAGKDDVQAAAEIRRLLPRSRPRDGASRIVPLPEVVPPRGRGLTSIASKGSKPSGPARGRGLACRDREGEVAIRRRLPGPGPTLRRRQPAAVCAGRDRLREVLDRQPDHAEARQAAGLRPARGRLGPAVRGRASSRRARQSPGLRLGPRRLGGPPRCRRAARRQSSAARKVQLAPGRRGRPAALGLEESLEDPDRALRDPDRRPARRGDRVRPPARGVLRPLLRAHGRRRRRERSRWPGGSAPRR